MKSARVESVKIRTTFGLSFPCEVAGLKYSSPQALSPATAAPVAPAPKRPRRVKPFPRGIRGGRLADLSKSTPLGLGPRFVLPVYLHVHSLVVKGDHAPHRSGIVEGQLVAPRDRPLTTHIPVRRVALVGAGGVVLLVPRELRHDVLAGDVPAGGEAGLEQGHRVRGVRERLAVQRHADVPRGAER